MDGELLEREGYKVLVDGFGEGKVISGIRSGLLFDHEKEKEAQLVLAEQRLNKHKEEKDAEDLAWALPPPTPPNVGMRRTPYPRRMHGERGRAALRRSLA